MRNWCFQTFFPYFLLAMICTTAFSGGAAARELAAIKASGKMIVAVPSQQSPPFFFDQDGVLKGIDIDLAKSIAESLNVDIEFNRNAKTFNEAVDLVASNRADMAVAKISRTLSRAESVLFSEPYVTLKHALLVNRLRFAEIAHGKPVAEIMQSYTGSIGVIAGSSFVGYGRKYFPKATITEYKSWEDVVAAVAKGEVSAAYRDAFEVRLILKLHPDLSVDVRSVVIDDIQDALSIVVGSSSPMLQNYVNIFLDQNNIKYNSEKILEKYKYYVK